MSLPGLACLYGGLVPKKWAVNTMFMCFTGFSAVLVVWVLWGYKMGFGTPIGGGAKDQVENFTYTGNFFHNFFNNFVGHPETSLNGRWQGIAGQAVRQRRHGAATHPGLEPRCSTSSSYSPRSRRCCSSEVSSAESR